MNGTERLSFWGQLYNRSFHIRTNIDNDLQFDAAVLGYGSFFEISSEEGQAAGCPFPRRNGERVTANVRCGVMMDNAQFVRGGRSIASLGLVPSGAAQHFRQETVSFCERIQANEEGLNRVIQRSPMYFGR